MKDEAHPMSSGSSGHGWASRWTATAAVLKTAEAQALGSSILSPSANQQR